MANDSFHEDLKRTEQVAAGSERSFGRVFAAVFFIIAMLPTLNWSAPHFWALIVSAIFLLLAQVAPGLLRLPNLLWFRFGLLLHKIVSPVVLGLLFFLTVTPIAFIYRILGKDPLRLKFDHAANSYWIERTPPGPPPDMMTRQF